MGNNTFSEPQITPENITGAQLDTLIALVESGPLWDGDLPSKTARDSLVEQGFAAKVLVKGEDGFQAVTYKGSDLYKKIFGDKDTVEQAKAFRQAKRAMVKMMRN